MKQSLPRTLSMFWFFCTIQLYLDLNLLNFDSKPFASLLLSETTSSSKVKELLPEISHLVLSIICLFYFFALMFRFNELFGPDDLDSIVD